jgi:hypothetical protein
MQTGSADEWLIDLAAAVTAAAPNPRPAHEAWWASFWSRSHIAVNSSAWSGRAVHSLPADRSYSPSATRVSVGAQGSTPPVAGAALWLRASSLSAQVRVIRCAANCFVCVWCVCLFVCGGCA